MSHEGERREGSREQNLEALRRALGPVLAARAAREGGLAEQVAQWHERRQFGQAMALAVQAQRSDKKSPILRPVAWIDRALEKGRGPAAQEQEQARQAEEEAAARGRAAFEAACASANATTPQDRMDVVLTHLEKARASGGLQ